MGIKLMVEVLDDAPDSLTFRERYVLLALAENFNDGTRQGWPAYDGDEERSKRFRRRARCSRAQFYETLKSLTAKGAIEVVVRGQKGRQAVYRIPRLADAFSVPKTETLTGVPETLPDTLPGGLPEASARAHGGLTESAQCPGNPDPEADSVSRFSEFSVPESGTPTPQVPSWLNTLNAANAAREGWGVWGEGSATEATDADSQPVAASADAPAWDGLRPRGFAAPATKNDQSKVIGERPAPTEWEPGQEQRREAERSRILAAIERESEEMILAFEYALGHQHGAALARGRKMARTGSPDISGDPDADPVLHQRVWALVYAYNSRPLAGWPISVLPIPLRGPDLQEEAA